MHPEVRAHLQEMQEAEYAAFTGRLTPGAGTVLGVRLPLLRRYAAELAAGMGEASRSVLSSLPSTNSKEVISKIGNNRWMKFSSDTNAIKAENLYLAKDSLANVKGMGLKDAIYLLENQGYKVKFKGHGKVVSQTPRAGADLPKGETVTLSLDS